MFAQHRSGTYLPSLSPSLAKTITLNKTTGSATVSSTAQDMQSSIEESDSSAAVSQVPLSESRSLPCENEKAAVQDQSEASTEKAPQSEPSTSHPPSPPYKLPSGLKLSVIIIGLCLAVFLVALDNTIITTAIPKISDDFKALDDIGWYGSAYFLTTCSFQLLYGKFYTFFNIKIVFLCAISIFELGSLVCGVAPNSIALICGRAIAGLGAAGIFSGCLIIIVHNVPLEKRPPYNSAIIGMYGIASVAGPLIGGAFAVSLLLSLSNENLDANAETG